MKIPWWVACCAFASIVGGAVLWLVLFKYALQMFGVAP